MIAVIENWTDRSRLFVRFFQYHLCEILCFFLIINISVISPTVRREPQCRQKIHFAIRSTRFAFDCSICLALPSKQAFSLIPRFILHICLCPAPNFIELFLVAHLNTYHHAIRHTLGSNVLISRIVDVRHIVTCFIIHRI